MNFIIEQYDNRFYLTYPISLKSSTDPLLMGMLTNNRIPGFAEFTMRDVDGIQQLCYDIHDLRSMKDIFTGTVSRRVLLRTFRKILSALDTAQDYMIEESSVVLEPEYIFLDPSTFRIALVCLPLMDYRNGNDLKSFFKSIMFNTIFDYNEPCDHVARIMNYLNGSEFSLADFRDLLAELDVSAVPSVPPVAGEQDLFFDFVTPAQPEQSAEDFFGTASGKSSKTPLQEADDILSAALRHPDPITEKVADPSQSSAPLTPAVDLWAKAPAASDPLSVADQLLSAALSGEPAPQAGSPAFSWDAPGVPEKAPLSTASDPLSVAEQLLSAALGADPIAQETPLRTQTVPAPSQAGSMPKKDAPNVPIPSSGESGTSARSRRSRARKENRETQSSPQATPVRQAPKESATAGSDAFDILGSFASPVSSKKTDAMKAADAILSALDLPAGEPKEAPATDYFADLFTPEAKDSTPPAEDNFSVFTTPIVSSRRKPGTQAPAKAPEPKTAPSAPTPPKKSMGAEEPFDFFAPTKATIAHTDAMKTADALLSAALAGIPTMEETVPGSKTTQKAVPPTAAATAPKQSAAEDFSRGLDAFSFSPGKKTAAMLEAESILDSLDLFAPSTESMPAPAPVKEPVQRNPEPLPRQESVPQQEPPRKGGFFSRLRKKDDTPAPQAPTPPVVPYFGSDGETTILNVAQQMTMPAAPYLIRSSNGDTVVLSKAVFRIGKDRDFADYCISDNSAISRRHANIMVRNGDVFIIDTNSTNHTYVNGVMIRSNTEVKLTHGDEIRLANEDFVLYCAGIL